MHPAPDSCYTYRALTTLSSADFKLAHRLELAEAMNVRAMAESVSESVSEVVTHSVGGGWAIFAGAGSAMTHVMGLGLQGPVPPQELEAMEEFFRVRGSNCVVDLCPLADISVVAFLQTRPYRLSEFNNVMARRIRPDEEFGVPVGVTRIEAPRHQEWARVVSRAFAEQMPVTEDMVVMMSSTCVVSRCWLAGQSEPEAGAAMGIQDNVALFYGDATAREVRRKGWQTALIQARLAEAQSAGCDLAMACVLPGSASHRNYERAGFQLVYMRVNLVREF